MSGAGIPGRENKYKAQPELVQEPSGRTEGIPATKKRGCICCDSKQDAVGDRRRDVLCVFMEWIGEIITSRDRHMAVDGKVLKGAAQKVKGKKAPMLLNAVDAGTGLVLAQLPVSEKTNEIIGIPQLLRLLDLCGSIVTTDSVGTQTEIMEQILEQGGHFVMMVKQNQPQTYEEIKTYLGKPWRIIWRGRKMQA